MAGHSKWANIKRRKGAQDAKRGKIFTKLIKEIHVAVKEGGGPDQDANPRLRLAIQNAKGVNMPKDNIERAIKKASGADATEYTTHTYEGYGPHGIAVFVETMTDNLNRTVAAVRAAFTKYGGSLGTNGSLDFIFDRKGVFTFKKPEGMEREEFELEVIDAGAEEVEENDGFITIYTAMEDFGSMQSKLEELNIETETSELQRIPKTTTSLGDEDLQSVWKLIEALEDDDDVQKVYHNLDINESQYELI
ncbi:YebC/PmpR family DNA-binding transcriptional regulator [Marinigracilibium pacificum]|uniref:Probable transcriptional regulatory protein HH304_06400 n=1 Tax=Marinigracilibium pacificum TaxID=2729599 RepID=A0A848J4C6_9BACT|nr:YebC/PmpR family DNA-binding transcriptional regulator [Marinigracilibium pacificum]NMM48022.1 YebC/PmpR family DNA-binding transcriptional regulator [Marinigracilibium pacificum]